MAVISRFAISSILLLQAETREVACLSGPSSAQARSEKGPKPESGVPTKSFSFTVLFYKSLYPLLYIVKIGLCNKIVVDHVCYTFRTIIPPQWT